MSPLIPLVLSVALFMENMDATVIATSLPAIAGDIGTTPVTLKLALTAYYVALAIFVPVSACLADRMGTRNLLRISMLVFVAGSLGCAFSGSVGQFVAARFVEGMGGAMMTPVARLTLFRLAPRAELVRATAWLTVPAVIAPTLGPPLGGFLTTYFGWQWIFFINLPIAAVGILLVTLYLPEAPRHPPTPIDGIGFVLLAIAFAGFVFGVSLVNLPVLPRWLAVTSIGAGLAAGIGYLRHARRTPAPLLDPRAFRAPAFRATLIGGSLLLAGCAAMPFLVSLMLQEAFGMTPFQAGLITFASAAGALAAKPLAGPLFAALGFRSVMIATAVLSAAGIAVKAALAPAWPVVAILALIFFNGLIRSIFFTGHAVLTVADVPENDAGQATAIATVARPIASALSVALAGGILSAGCGGGALAGFHLAFLACAAVAALSALPFVRLDPRTGATVSGHRRGTK
jgi:EmrB/QacA subfamily drug resistance transporter